ncbi:hypothetical protein [Aestuariivirga sp.]|uniref:hypothetical protein n=1 Tax=Aestuariivirga sp. TaxID=2650926 RepID=UPI003592EA16
MQKLRELINRLPLSIVAIACLTLGLAPFVPAPHVWEKLRMLTSGTLNRPIDILDLLMHGAPFIVAGVKFALMPSSQRQA